MNQWKPSLGSKGCSFLCLAALVALLSLACSQQASNAPADEGTQVAESTPAPEPAPAPEPVPQQYEPTQQAPPMQEPAPSRPAPRPAPSAPPVPKTIAVTVPESTPLNIKITESLNSGMNHEGDAFTATLVEAVIVGDRVVLPEGSTIEGTLVSVVPAKKGIKESGGAMTLSFDRITTPSGNSASMAASFAQQAKSTGKKAGTIGGSAAGGALLGKVLGGSTKDAAIGAVVGGAIGTGVAAGTKGSELKLEAGTPMTITLERPITLQMKR
ncbi:MAG: hypothetical protein L0Z52_12970 [Acidobacteria bacterium]|nr:hypothetical protein [Acidobacteriota bacterium]